MPTGSDSSGSSGYMPTDASGSSSYISLGSRRLLSIADRISMFKVKANMKKHFGQSIKRNVDDKRSRRRLFQSNQPAKKKDLVYSDIPDVLGDEIAIVSMPTGVAVNYLYSHYVNYISITATDVIVDPKANEDLDENCGYISSICSNIQLALSRYTLDGTRIILKKGVHKVNDLATSANDLHIVSEAASKTSYVDDSEVVLDCSESQCFKFTGSGYFFGGLHITNAKANKGAVAELPDSTYYYFRNVVFNNTKAIDGSGGAFTVGTDTSLLLAYTKFIDSHASEHGGAIYSSRDSFNSIVLVYASDFDDNTAQGNAGAIYSYRNTLYLYDSSFTNNTSSGNGGALMSDSTTDGYFANNVFNNNRATSGNGGAIYFQSSKDIDLVDTIFGYNVANLGGAIFQEFSEVTIQGENTEFILNGAYNDGGSLYCLGDLLLQISDATFTNNVAEYGAGIYSVFCSPKINNSVFNQNNATFDGGAIYAGSSSKLDLVDTSFDGNSAGKQYDVDIESTYWISGRGYGGAIRLNNADKAHITNSTFDSNNAFKGGALYISGSVMHEIEISNFNENRAALGGGIYWNNLAPSLDNQTLDNGLNGNNENYFISSIAKSIEVNVPLNYEYQPSSGYIFTEPIGFALYDAYSHKVLIDYESTISIISDDFLIIGNNRGTLNGGNFTFSDENHFGVTGIPNNTASFYAIALTNDGNLESENIDVTLRSCVAGEVLQNNICVKCPAGTYSPAFGLECEPCSGGFYSSEPGSTYCTICPVGYFSSITGGASECTACKAASNAFSDREGAIQCMQCPTGSQPISKLSGDANSTSAYYYGIGCICSKDYLQIPCDHRLATNPCDEGFDTRYDDAIQWPYECATCIEGDLIGANCTTSNTTIENVKPQVGYSFGVGEVQSESNTYFIDCFNDACGGSEGCKVGYTGLLCNECDRFGGEYTYSDGSTKMHPHGFGLNGPHNCEPCPDPSLNKLRLTAAGFLILFAIGCVTAITVKGARNMTHKEKHSFYIKILTSALQFNSLASSFDYSWPKIIENMMEVQTTATNIDQAFLNVDCFFNKETATDAILEQYNVGELPTFWISTILVMFAPVILAVAIFLLFNLRYLLCRERGICDGCYHRCNQKMAARKGLTYLKPQDDPHSVFYGKSYRDRKKLYFKRLLREFVSSVVVTLFLIHPTIIKQTFSTISCFQVGPNEEDDFYLLEDLSLKCWTDDHYEYMTYTTVPMMILEVIGIPFIAWLLLFRNRKIFEQAAKYQQSHHGESILTKANGDNATDHNAAMDKIKNVYVKYGFLFDGYELERWYWEIVVVGRKICLISLASYWANEVHKQTLMAVVLTIICLTAQQYYMPFEHDEVDDMETFSLFTACMTFTLGQFLFTIQAGSTDAVVLSFAIVVNNFIFYAVILYRIFSEIINSYKKKALKRKQLKEAKRKKRESLEMDIRNSNPSGPRRFTATATTELQVVNEFEQRENIANEINQNEKNKQEELLQQRLNEKQLQGGFAATPIKASTSTQNALPMATNSALSAPQGGFATTTNTATAQPAGGFAVHHEGSDTDDDAIGDHQIRIHV